MSSGFPRWVLVGTSEGATSLRAHLLPPPLHPCFFSLFSLFSPFFSFFPFFPCPLARKRPTNTDGYLWSVAKDDPALRNVPRMVERGTIMY